VVGAHRGVFDGDGGCTDGEEEMRGASERARCLRGKAKN
jgi:hypothetical protein